MLQRPAELPVVRQLAVVDHGDVGEGIGPVGMGRANVDVRFRGHPRVPDGVGALESGKAVLLAHDAGVAQVLDQFQRTAEGEDFRPFDILHIVGEALEPCLVRAVVAGEPEAIAERILGRLVLGHDLHLHATDARIHLGLALLDLAVDVEAGAEVFLLGHLEAHHMVGARGQAIDCEACRIRPPVLERLEHRRHLRPDVAARSAVDQSCYPAH